MLIPCESCQSVFELDSKLVKPTGTKVKCSRCQYVFKIYTPPSVGDRRKHKRIKTKNLISYFAYNEKGKLISHGMGVALDISKGGILMETPHFIESGIIVITAVNREKQFIEVEGNLKYSSESSSETYLCGIEFTDNEDRVINFITNLIKEYNIQKNNLFITVKKRLDRKSVV